MYWIRTIFVALNLGLLAAPLSYGRTWRDKTGEFAIEATLVKVEADVVWLRRDDNGEVIKVPLDRLSNEHQQFVRKTVGRVEGDPKQDAPSDPGQGIAIGAPVRIEIPNGRISMMTYAALGGPYVAIDNKVYNISTGRVRGRMKPQQRKVSEPNRALSPDGGYFAICHRVGRVPAIEIRRSRGGDAKPVIELAKSGSPGTKWMDFISNTHIAWLGRAKRGYVCRVFEIPSGKEVRSFAVEGYPRSFALHPNGRRLATSDGKSISFYDLIEGKKILQESTASDLKEMSYSSDGTQLAVAFRESGQTRLVVYDESTEVIYDHLIPQAVVQRSSNPKQLQWLPDGTGWLLGYEHLVDRQTKKVVWQLQPYRLTEPRTVVLNNDTVLTFKKAGRRTLLTTVRIPKQTIQKSLAALKKDEAAWLKPGMKVQIEIKIGALRYGKRTEIEKSLEESLADRLDQNGLISDSEGALTLSVDYSEKAGPYMKYVEPAGLTQRNPKIVASGRGTDIKCRVKLVTSDGRELWSGSFDYDSSLSGIVYSKNPRDWHKTSVGILTTQLERCGLPYFISKADPKLTLPVISNFRPY